jgi:hypothetical protein
MHARNQTKERASPQPGSSEPQAHGYGPGYTHVSNQTDPKLVSCFRWKEEQKREMSGDGRERSREKRSGDGRGVEGI